MKWIIKESMSTFSSCLNIVAVKSNGDQFNNVDGSNLLLLDHDENKENKIISYLKQYQNNQYQEIKVVDYYPTDIVIDALFNALTPLGKLTIVSIGHYKLLQLIDDLKVYGFTNITNDNSVLRCVKPSYDFASTSKIQITNPAIAKPSAWKITSDDLLEDDIIDENELLQNDVNFQVESSEVSCGEESNGKKRACKNCSCGLAEQEALENDTQSVNIQNTGASSSSCGSCYKGDAFRCGSCPFLGLPAFEKGQEKVVLSMRVDI